MMKNLLSPTEVIELAFVDTEYFPERRIGGVDIAAAEARDVVPVTGKRLWRSLLEGAYPSLRNAYAAPASAYAVRWSLHASSEALSPAAQAALHARMLTALKALSDHLNAHAEDYPEYDPRKNVLNRISVDGGVVLAVSKK